MGNSPRAQALVIIKWGQRGGEQPKRAQTGEERGGRQTGKWPLLTAELSPDLPSLPPSHTQTRTHPAGEEALAHVEDCCLGGGKGSWQFSRACLLFKKLEPGCLSLLPIFLIYVLFKIKLL